MVLERWRRGVFPFITALRVPGALDRLTHKCRQPLARRCGYVALHLGRSRAPRPPIGPGLRLQLSNACNGADRHRAGALLEGKRDGEPRLGGSPCGESHEQSEGLPDEQEDDRPFRPD